MKNITKTTKTILFASLIAAMILPFSGMNNAQAEVDTVDKDDVIDSSLIKQTLTEPKMLTETDIEKLAPKYLELEKTRNSLVDSSKELTAADKVLLADTEKQMTSILERVAEHEKASKIALEMPAIDQKRMELAVEEIIQSDLPFSHVGVDPHTKTVIVGLVGDESLTSYEKQINAITTLDVPITVYKGEYASLDACTNQKNVICNPVVAGIQIEWANGLCTQSLEVRDGWWPWADKGWLTAGHCFPLGAIGIDQPAGNHNIADVTIKDYVNFGDCDCEFMEKTTARSSGSLVWLSSNNYKAITSKGDAPVNAWVLASLSMSGGFDLGQVWLTQQTITFTNGMTITGMTLVTGVNSIGGDSGSPYTQVFGSKYHGIHSGSSPTFTVFTPWSNISPSLGVY
jgi:hypothetical protein